MTTVMRQDRGVSLLRPRTVAELAGQRRDHPDAVLIGGGTLIVPWRHRQRHPPAGLQLASIPALRWLDRGGCGANTTMADLLADGRVPAGLRRAAGSIGGPAVRELATVAGNVAAAAPGCVTVALIAMAACAEVLRPDGTIASVPLQATVRQSREPILAIRWDPSRPVVFEKVRAGSGGPVVVSVAVAAPADPDAPAGAVSAGAPDLPPRRLPLVEAALAATGPADRLAPALRTAYGSEGLDGPAGAIAASLTVRAVDELRMARTGRP
jgi:aerobic carbon-monoxide dehydrogenase medium subunit